MASYQQQLFQWDGVAAPDVALPPPVRTVESTAATPEAGNLVAPSLPDFGSLPITPPLREALEAGVFGVTPEGPIDLDDDAVWAITHEHAREMMSLLAELQAVEDGLRTGEDPRTGKVPKTAQSAGRLREYLEREGPRLATAYGDARAAFEGGFGNDAAQALDLWVRKAVADCIVAPTHRYDPGHPWHYYHEGDDAPPIPVEDIEPDLEAGRFLERDLPKNRVKRTARIRELLATERERVEEDKRRYQEIVERGAEALSRYDREIAHSSDAMARATALSLKYNHIRYGLGRLAWLQAHAPLGTHVAGPLNNDPRRDKDPECKD